MSIRFTVTALIAAVLSTAGATSVAAQDRHEMTKGSTVSITTCVVRSLDDDDEFVLTNLTDMPVHPATAGKVMYWVDEVKKIRSFVGKRIQFEATIKDVDRREVELKHADLNGNGNGNGNGYIRTAVAEIEGPGNQVKAPPEAIGLSAVAGPMEGSIPTTLVELKINGDVRTVADSCATSNAVMTAAAVTETETRTAVVEETASAINTTRETTVTTPAAEVAVAEVAVETPAPIATPEVSAEASITTPAAPAVDVDLDVDTERTELPRTSTALPLLGLLGFGSLVGAAALRVRRR